MLLTNTSTQSPELVQQQSPNLSFKKSEIQNLLLENTAIRTDEFMD